MPFLRLNYFKVIAETLNISQAAQQLSISQSSLSQSLQRLETELGYPLFDRKGKRITLNSNGEILLKYVNQIDHALISAQKELADKNHQLQSQVTLYVGCASQMLPKLLKHLNVKLPEITFRILQNQESVPSTDIDLKILSSPFPMEGQNRILLLEEQILLTVPVESPLNDIPDIYSKDLLNESFLMLGNKWSLGILLREYFEHIQFSPNISMTLDNPSLMREFLRERYGIAFSPEITWGTNWESHSLVLRAVKDMPMKRYVYLEWQEGSYLSDNVHACILAILEFFTSDEAVMDLVKEVRVESEGE